MSESASGEADSSSVSKNNSSSHQCPFCEKSFDTKRGVSVHRGRMHEGPWDDEETLRELYVERQMGREEIANHFDVGNGTIQRALDRSSIETRDRCGIEYDAPHRDKETLERLYHGEGMTMTGIAGKFDVSTMTIHRWVNKHDIEIRGEHGVRFHTECDYCGWEMSLRPSAFNRSDRDFCDQVCRGEWLSENVRGEDHPNWKGGHAVDYGPNWEEQREKALDRDSHECRRCGVDKYELGRSPDVHHRKRIKWFKQNYDEPEWYEEGNKLENLITLCRSCHGKWERIPLQFDTR